MKIPQLIMKDEYKILSELPYPIIEIPNFISHSDCDHIIDISKDRMIPAEVFGHKVDESRTAYNCQYKDDWDDDDVIQNLRKKMSNAISWSLDNMEKPETIRYEVGQKYFPHYDFTHPRLLESGKKNRVATFIIYLDPCKEGGETVFMQRKLKILPAKGSAIFFNYNDQISSMTLHGGMPVKNGTKWIMTNWILQQEPPST